MKILNLLIVLLPLGGAGCSLQLVLGGLLLALLLLEQARDVIVPEPGSKNASHAKAGTTGVISYDNMCLTILTFLVQPNGKYAISCLGC